MPNLIQSIRNLFVPSRNITLRQEPTPLSSTATATTIQNALRAAEQGDTRQLFTLYRDIFGGQGHVMSELNKRKMAVLSEQWNVIPVDKSKPDDVKAAESCKEMVKIADGWMNCMNVLMDATLWPVVVGEKIFRPVNKGETDLPLRFTFSYLHQINPQLLCFNPGWGYGDDAPIDQWESQVRLFPVNDRGFTFFSLADAKFLEQDRHMVYRGHTQSGRDCWGGPMRAILGWWFLAECGRDWFGRFMERYGSPFVVGKIDAKNPTAVTFMQTAFAEATKIGGMVIDHGSEVQLVSAASAANEQAYQSFLEVCHREISKIILGQTLSADSQPTGLGSSVGKLHSDVREDIKKYDRLCLGNAIERQIFAQFLKLNAIRGRVPKIVWGGLEAEDSQAMGNLLVSLNTAGLQPTDDALEGIGEKIGFPIERKEAPEKEVPDKIIGKDGVIIPNPAKEKEMPDTEDDAEEVKTE
jgi:phage gp29-like protein